MNRHWTKEEMTYLEEKYKDEIIDDIISTHIGIGLFVNYTETKVKLPDFTASYVVWQITINNVKYEIKSSLLSRLIEIKIILSRGDANNIKFNVSEKIFEYDAEIVKKIKRYGKIYQKLLETEQRIESIN